jgi:DNA-directed RNA polymerase specialized sigma24 family protein
LRVLEDVPYAGVAHRLGITEASARARVSRALRSLADEMEVNRTIQEAELVRET